MNSTQLPRLAIADPSLVRPNWTKLETRNIDCLWLDRNENSDPALAEVVASVLEEVAPHAVFSYPENGSLYHKLAAWVGVKPKNLILSAGSDGAIRATFEAFVAPGDMVIHTHPTFAMYEIYCRIYGAEAQQVNYQPSDNGPNLEAHDLCNRIRIVQPRLVCLPNPDSPTGHIFQPEEMRAIIEEAGNFGTIILVDEAYFPFYRETCVPWIREYGNLIVTRSTGKAWGMAGFRIGYACASPELTKLLHKVRAMYEVSTVAATVFEGMLDHVDEMEASVCRIEAGKAMFRAAMEKFGFKTLDGYGNFIHVAFGQHAETIHAALDDFVYYRKDFNHPSLKGFSRFSATTPSLFETVIDRIADAVENTS